MKSLRSRLLLCYTVMVTLTVMTTASTGYFLVRRQLLKGADFLLKAEFQEVEPKLRGLRGPLSQEAIEEAIGEHTRIDAPFYFFQVHTAPGTILYRSANLGQKLLPDLTAYKAETYTMRLPDLGLLRVAEFQHGAVHVQIASGLNYLTTLSHRFSQALLLGIPVVLASSILLAYILCELTLRPLRAIEQTARRISLSNLKERIPLPGGRDEVTKLAELLNETFDRLEKSFEEVKQFTADFSHELRTPLSMIALHAERLSKKRDLDSESAAELAEILSETRRLNHIIDQLLTLARAEAHTLPLDLHRRSTGDFIRDFEEDAAASADAAGRFFRLTQNEDLTAAFDAVWLRQALFNIFSNALKYSPPAGVIELASALHNGAWRITIQDEGPGIPATERESVFQRFKRLPNAADSTGAGLGLAVARSIVQLHKGSLHAEEPSSGRGARMVIELPLA